MKIYGDFFDFFYEKRFVPSVFDGVESSIFTIKTEYVVKYQITGTSGTFNLAQGDDFASVKTIDLNGNRVSLPSFNGQTEIQSIGNGTIITKNCDDFFMRGEFGPVSPSIQTFNANFTGVKSANNMFKCCGDLTDFNGNLKTVESMHHMLWYCTNLTSCTLTNLLNLKDASFSFGNARLPFSRWETAVPNLENAEGMFFNVSKDFSFNVQLPKLKNAHNMFAHSNLSYFLPTELPELTNGDSMFAGVNVDSFDLDCPKLVSGTSMFEGCSAVTVSLDAPLLDSAEHMFGACFRLRTVELNIPSMANCENMFESVAHISAAPIRVEITTNATMAAQITKDYLGGNLSDTTVIVNGQEI